MKRIILIIVALVALAFAGAALAGVADKKPEPPGQGPCNHGNSNKPCKDDPQPDHGGDCDEHGPKDGGVNEDHCKGGDETTPTTPTETTPTETTPTTPEETTPSTSDTPTQPTETQTTPTTEEPENPSTSPAPETGSSTSPGVEPGELEESLEQQAQANGAGTSSAPTSPAATNELPYTGLPLGVWVAIGLGLVAAGLGLRRWSR